MTEEQERLILPTLPQELLYLIGEYGSARSDGCNEVEILHRWHLMIDGIKAYARASLAKPQPVVGALTDDAGIISRARFVVRGRYGSDAVAVDVGLICELIELATRATLSAPVAQPAKCLMCNGHGMIGGFVSDGDGGGGYDSEPCPDCAVAQPGEAVSEKKTPIEQLMAEYTAECCDFTNLEWVRASSLRYTKTMPDSQVRCLLYALATPIAAQPAAAEPVETQPGSPHFDGADAWNAAPSAAAEPAMTPSAKWGRLYTTANAVTALIGYKGQIDSDADEITSLMDALHDLDGCEWMPGLTPSAAPSQAAAVPEAVEDAAALLRKYRKLCVEIGRGDSYHLARIDAAIESIHRYMGAIESIDRLAAPEAGAGGGK